MDVIAHRGFAATGVENALPTLVAAERRADADQLAGQNITSKIPNLHLVRHVFGLAAVQTLFGPYSDISPLVIAHWFPVWEE